MPRFSRSTLLLRNLKYFRAANLAVLAGAAVATAVLAGALMVDDSVRGSLRDLAEHRLGFVDHAMISPRFVSQSLAGRIKSSPDFAKDFDTIAAGIQLRGGATPTANLAPNIHSTPGVQITALDGQYAVKEGSATVNARLATDLPAQSGLRFSLPAPDDAPRDSTLARRARNDSIKTFAVDRYDVAPAGGFLDLFNLAGGQRQGPAAWVNLASLQDELDRAEQVNVLLVGAKPNHQATTDAASLNKILHDVATLADYGIDVGRSRDKRDAVLSSRATYLAPAIVDAAARIAARDKLPLTRASVYLVNRVSKVGDDKAGIHYAIAAGLDRLGDDVPPLKDDEAAVNQWTADQLGLKIGDVLRLEYYLRQPNGDLAEVASDRPGVGLQFKVARILPMTGLGADPTLTPTYKGLTDAATIADWRPPAGLNIDKKKVTKADEKYWTDHKGAPKLFVSLDAASKLWGSAFGDVTSLRVPADKSKDFAEALRREIDPAALGIAFRPVKEQQLAAASGSTDFAGLFIGFSFFLLTAAVVLVAMLFRLGIEQRARQLGLLAACGFAPRQLRNLALKEGLLLSVTGAILGIGLGIAYTALMIYGLRTWWVGAIGTTALRLHVEPLTLVYGFVGSVIVAMLAIAWAVRRVARTSAAALLAGGMTAGVERLTKPPRKSTAAAIAVAVLALALFAAGAMKSIDTTGAFLGGGSLLLLAALLFTFAGLRPTRRAMGDLSLASLALRNATRNRARSVLCVALIALASFTLVTASSMESGTPADTFDKQSGAGGYALIVQADIPLLGDLNTLAGRELLMRLPSAKDPRWDKAHFVMMRSWAGQDISCLNVTQPTSPTILAVPPSLRDARRFSFAGKTKDPKNTWHLLDDAQPDDAIPVIADDESAKYILHLNLGDTLAINDAAGRPRKLRLVATLAGSIFQSELLMSEANFLKLFPAQSGYSTILVNTTQADAPAVANLLRETLNDVGEKEQSDYSATIQTTADRLAAYHEVANTYLATFRVLGALGLMLGTIGLAVVLVRNLIERRPELALLGALGFAPAARTRLVLWENVALLLLGLATGAGCALTGVIPHVLTSSYRINVPAVSIALAAVLAVGLIALVLAVRLSAKRVHPAALRAE